MTARLDNRNQPSPRLDLSGIADAVIANGLKGGSVEEQLTMFAERVYAAGFPMKRVNVGMSTLHPRYGAHSYAWSPGMAQAEFTPRVRGLQLEESFINSPIHHMRSNRVSELRFRLDTNQKLPYPILDDLREMGMTDYAAKMVVFGSEEDTSEAGGIFFSCATDEVAGFDDGQLDQVTQLLPAFTLAAKSRATYDVANTVLATYLGEDAGRRVLTGDIVRGSVQTIRAVIWFCDLRGFTRVSDRLPEDELIDTLDDYLEFMAVPVHRNGGQILKFLGDGFLATFDLTDLKDAAICTNATNAAGQLATAFPAFNAKREEAGKAVMDFGLALHMGDVLYGNIGAEDRLDFTVIGPAVNEASRIQALCKTLDHNVLFSDSYYQIATHCRHVLRSVGFHGLRGVREPQELFTLAL